MPKFKLRQFFVVIIGKELDFFTKHEDAKVFLTIKGFNTVRETNVPKGINCLWLENDKVEYINSNGDKALMILKMVKF